jgi:thioredoxin reductase
MPEGTGTKPMVIVGGGKAGGTAVVTCVRRVSAGRS